MWCSCDRNKRKICWCEIWWEWKGCGRTSQTNDFIFSWVYCFVLLLLLLLFLAPFISHASQIRKTRKPLLNVQHCQQKSWPTKILANNHKRNQTHLNKYGYKNLEKNEEYVLGSSESNYVLTEKNYLNIIKNVITFVINKSKKRFNNSKLATLFEGDSKAPFSIASTPFQ